MLKNGIHIEQRLKKELIELGIFDMNDFAKRKEDEVMNEIKRVRVELKAIADYNLNELKQLLVAVKEEMKRLEIKQKLDQVDQEVWFIASLGVCVSIWYTNLMTGMYAFCCCR